MESTKLKYSRILLKMSGEALAGDQKFGLCPKTVRAIAREIREVVDLQAQVGIVIGGGNIFRGVAESARNMERTVADQMGMLATVINSLALQDALEKEGVHCRVMSAIAMHEVAGGDLCGWNRQPLFYHGHRGGFTGHRDRRPGLAQGH